MLVDLEATRLCKMPSVTDLVKYVSRPTTRFNSSSRDVNKIIHLCSIALLDFNPKCRSADFEHVYQVRDNFIIIGVLHDGNLIRSYDAQALCDQIHIDDTMALFVHNTKPLKKVTRHDMVMVDIPNKLKFSDIYYSPQIFAEFLINESTAPNFTYGSETQLADLRELISISASIVKEREKMTSEQTLLIERFLNAYGAFIAGKCIKDYKVPEKYVISKKWFDQVDENLGSNPYFVFRHVWRCYFRLCEEGYVFNA